MEKDATDNLPAAAFPQWFLRLAGNHKVEPIGAGEANARNRPFRFRPIIAPRLWKTH